MAMAGRRTGAGTGVTPGPRREPRRRRHGGARGPGLAAAVLAALLGAACSAEAPPAASDAGRLGLVVVGCSSRADVLAALGRPARTERSAAGEAWNHEAKAGGVGAPNLLGGAAATSGLIGAVVPYAGLVGSGLGLAGAALGGARPDQGAAALTVAFTAEGIVRDCILSSTAAPAGVPGSAPADAGVVDCRRPGPTPTHLRPPSAPPPSGAVPGALGR